MLPPQHHRGAQPSETVRMLLRLAATCPEYPSLSHPDLDYGLITLPSGDVLPKDTVRRAVLNSFQLLGSFMGYEFRPFHLAIYAWCRAHPQSAITAPRGFGKTHVATYLRIIEDILRDFDTSVLLTSDTDPQVVSMNRVIKAHFEQNEWLKSLFGVPCGSGGELGFVGRGKWTDHRLEIAQRRVVSQEGTVDAIAVGGQVTGYHWHHIVADDVTTEKNSRSELLREQAYDFYFTTLKPTLRPSGTLQIRATRYHWDDLIGRIERNIAVDPRVVTGKREDGSPIFKSHVYHWEDKPVVERSAHMKVLKVSAITRRGQSIWEKRQPLEDRFNDDGTITQGLRSLQREMGERRFNEQYQMICEMVQDGARETECREEWLQFWRDAEAPRFNPAEYRFGISVDPAWTSREKAAKKSSRDRKPDFSAIAVGAMRKRHSRGERGFYVTDLYADLMSTGELTHAIKDTADAWADRFGISFMLIRIERTGVQIKNNPDFYRDIRDAVRPHRVRFVNPQQNKIAHARPLFLAAEHGEVALSPDIDGSGFVTMCGDFPFGERDDEIDAVAGLYHLLRRRRPDIKGIESRNVESRTGSMVRGVTAPQSDASTGGFNRGNRDSGAARGVSGGSRGITGGGRFR